MKKSSSSSDAPAASAAEGDGGEEKGKGEETAPPSQGPPPSSSSAAEGGTSGTGTSSTGGSKSDATKVLLPVLIIPGFMSSGLEVKESSVETPKGGEDWVGTRVWLNLPRLGLKGLHSGGALLRPEEEGEGEEEGEAVMENEEETVPSDGKEEEKDEEMGGGGSAGEGRRGHNRRPTSLQRTFSTALAQEYERDLPPKSEWLRHMSLSSDMITERPGMKVRAVEGLAGVDYLGQHDREFLVQQLINANTYVFGPVIDALKKVGYEEGLNLDAAPYDWRIPPCLLEERDGYFTGTMRKVEALYEKNGGTGVVLVCHSLGCRTAHYFLNFALRHPSGGQDWLDKYIHTYFPVGGPHLGAPKTLRAMVDGDKMGLDAFLSDEEGLIFGRSLGSGAWLLPTELPERNAPPVVCMRNEGAVRVTLVPSAVKCRELLADRADRDAESGEDTIPKVRLQIKFGGKSLSTSFKQLKDDYHMTVDFPERFSFPAPPSLPLTAEGGSDEFQILLLEPGLDRAVQSVRNTFWDSWICRPVVALFELAFCLIKFLLCGLYVFLKKFFGGEFYGPRPRSEETLPGAQDITDAAVDAGTKLASSKLAWCEPTHLTPILAGKNEAEFEVVLKTKRDKATKTKVRIEWVPSPIKPLGGGDFTKCSPISKPVTDTNQKHMHGLSDLTDGCPVAHVKKKHRDTIQYEPVSGDGLLRGEGMSYVFSLLRDRYDSDPIGPRSLSARDPPPVSRIRAVYGVNLPTEISAVYRRSAYFLEDGRLQKVHELDPDATMGLHESEYSAQRGVLKETRNTPQFVLGPAASKVMTKTYVARDEASMEFVGRPPPLSAASKKNKGGGGTKGCVDKVLPRPSPGEWVRRSGDGTVPYWSLQHCRTWAEEGDDDDDNDDDLEDPSSSAEGGTDEGEGEGRKKRRRRRRVVTVDEIEGAEHREILGNPTFHRILIEYVTQAKKEEKTKKE